MARPLRIEYANALYHVTCRGNEARSIFVDDKDRHRFIQCIKESLIAYTVQLHCYVLMLNHFHLLLKTPQANLSRFMQRFNTAYTTYFNLKHKRKGHLYQGRFKGIVIDADEYLIALSQYIHLNPVRVKRYRDAPLEEKIKFLNRYRWSSYPGYVNSKSQQPFIHYNEILSYFGGNNKDGRKSYREFVVAGLTGKLQNPLEEVRGGLVLGSDAFLEWVQDNFIDSRKFKEQDIESFREITRSVPVERIAKAVASEYRLNAESILRKNSPFSEARQVLIEICYRLNVKGKNMREMGSDLGGICGSRIGRVHAMMQKKARMDPALKKRIDRLIQQLMGQ